MVNNNNALQFTSVAITMGTRRIHAWAPAGFFPGVRKLGAWDESPLAESRDGAQVGVWGGSRRQVVNIMHK